MASQSRHNPNLPFEPKTVHTNMDNGLLVVDIAAIKPYEHNPRKGSNPEYDRIKASIRTEGMDHPFVITQRPGETGYLIHSGGNTRLQILQELYQETGNKRFGEVTCLYHPWTSETDVLLAHLRENDLRGDLTFLDKAQAVREAKHLIQEEQDEARITQVQLAETLKSRGYALSQGLISQMEYVVDRLMHVLPTALRAGMGRPQVERIRQLERAVRTLWLDRSVDTEEELDQVFTALCRRYDSPEWDNGHLRRALEAEISERAAISIHVVNMTLEGYLAGRRGAEVDTQWDTETDEDEASPIETTVTNSGRSVVTAEPQPAKPTTVENQNTKASESKQSVSNDSNVVLAESAQQTPQDDNSSDQDTDASSVENQLSQVIPLEGPTDLKSLRARAWTLASRLAQRNGLSELIQPLSGKGLGFLLRDVPDPALADQLDEDTLAQVSMVWWYLAAAAEVTVAPLDHLLPALAEESVLRRALEEQDAGLLFSSVWTLDPGHMGFRLWRRLDDRDWRDLVGLMETYRAIHQVAKSSSDSLWQ